MALHSVTTERHVDVRKTAIEEVTRGQELMLRLRSHIRLATHHDHNVCDFERLKLANDLSEGVLRALTMALSVLESSDQTRAQVKRVATEDDQNVRNQKRRRNVASWTKVTAAPHFDGYQWRKYGQKMILHSKHPREYYRCTYRKDEGCLATKQIQQEDSDDHNQPKFLVIYNNQHTCGKTITLPSAEVCLSSIPSDLSFLTFESQQFLQSPSSTTSLKEETDGKLPSTPQSDGCSSLVNQAVSSELMEMMEHILSITSFDIDDFVTTSRMVPETCRKENEF